MLIEIIDRMEMRRTRFNFNLAFDPNINEELDQTSAQGSSVEGNLIKALIFKNLAESIARSLMR